jgi:hypothetical protein
LTAEAFDGHMLSSDKIASYIQDFEGLPVDSSDAPPQEDTEQLHQDVTYLASAAYLHRATGEKPQVNDNGVNTEESNKDARIFVLDDRYKSTYQGELFDTGAAKWSTVGKPQLEA